MDGSYQTSMFRRGSWNSDSLNLSPASTFQYTMSEEDKFQNQCEFSAKITTKTRNDSQPSLDSNFPTIMPFIDVIHPRTILVNTKVGKRTSAAKRYFCQDSARRQWRAASSTVLMFAFRSCWEQGLIYTFPGWWRIYRAWIDHDSSR
jgi:hypothetical protein